MALLSWSPQYQIGHETIDAEHQELFRLVNAFHDNWLEKRSRQEIARVLNQLITYAQKHFQHEEAIMTTAAYPQLADHQFIHEAMVDTIFKLRQSFETNDFHLEIETMKFVRSWLVDHIVNHDTLFRNFLARHQASQP